MLRSASFNPVISKAFSSLYVSLIKNVFPTLLLPITDSKCALSSFKNDFIASIYVFLPIIFIVAAPFLRIWLNYEGIVGTVGNLHYSPPLTLLDHLSAIIATGKAPIFPWLACPIIGTLIGEAFVHPTPNPRQLVYQTLSVGSIMCILVPPLMFFMSDPVTQYPLTNGFFLLSTGMTLLAIATVVTTVDAWHWWNPLSRFFEVNGQITLISYLAHHLYGIVFFGVLLGFYRAIDVIGYMAITLSYLVLSLIFTFFWLPFRNKRSSYWDILVSYLILIIALYGRWIFAVLGFWVF